MIFVAETYSAWWYNKIVAFSESAVHSVASSNFGQLNASFDSDELLKTCKSSQFLFNNENYFHFVFTSVVVVC